MSNLHAKGHDYHLVDPSPWPALGSASVLTLALGFIWFLHGGPSYIALIGGLLLLYTMFVWWRDVIKEAKDEGHHTPVVQLHLRYGMLMFIASEVMFFMAWFWAYFNAAIYPTEAMGGTWPPEGIVTLDPWHLPFVNTVILLTSSCSVTWAHHAVREGDRKGAIQGLLVTVALGIFFTCVQAYEYVVAPFEFAGGIYGSTFFMATGFHGAHVLIGTCFLIVCLYRAIKDHFKSDQHFGLEAAAWYWHFVDVVWLFLFTFIYVWGQGPLSH